MTTLTMSSKISLSADTARINMNGTAVVYRPVGLTSGICWKGNSFILLTICSTFNALRMVHTTGKNYYNNRKENSQVGKMQPHKGILIVYY